MCSPTDDGTKAEVLFSKINIFSKFVNSILKNIRPGEITLPVIKLCIYFAVILFPLAKQKRNLNFFV